MRIDPDTCRDPVLLSAEVRRLQAVIAAGEPTLTDAEREAIYRASQYLSQNDVFEGMAEDAATLRGLLERLGQSQNAKDEQPAAKGRRYDNRR